MDHADARAVIEIAAAEPGGLDRLVAGDTADAAMLAGHLAACADCTEEMTRLRRLSQLVGETVRDLPPADLRERTLAWVAVVGRVRAAAPEAPSPTFPLTGDPSNPVTGAVAEQPGDITVRRRAGGLWRTAASIAAVLIAVIGTGLVVSNQRSEELAAQAAAIGRANQAIEALAKVTAWSMRVGAEEDAARVALVSPTGGPAEGNLLFAPGSGELVVVVSALDEPPAGQEYRCWVDMEEGRRPVGRMFFGGGLAYWVGPVDDLSRIVKGTRFGISLVDANGSSLSDGPVLSGTF